MVLESAVARSSPTRRATAAVPPRRYWLWSGSCRPLISCPLSSLSANELWHGSPSSDNHRSSIKSPASVCRNLSSTNTPWAVGEFTRHSLQFSNESRYESVYSDQNGGLGQTKLRTLRWEVLCWRFGQRHSDTVHEHMTLASQENRPFDGGSCGMDKPRVGRQRQQSGCQDLAECAAGGILDLNDQPWH